MKKVLIAILLVFFFVLAGCESCPASCDDGDACTKDYCSKDTEYECMNEIILNCNGNGICEEDEYGVSDDCPDCEDGDVRTNDYYDYNKKECVHEIVCQDECSNPSCENNIYYSCEKQRNGCYDKIKKGLIIGKCGVECISSEECPGNENCKNHTCQAFVPSKKDLELYTEYEECLKIEYEPWNTLDEYGILVERMESCKDDFASKHNMTRDELWKWGSSVATSDKCMKYFPNYETDDIRQFYHCYSEP